MSIKNRYFDFHFHPLFKQMLCKWEEDYRSTRDTKELIDDIDLQNYLLEKIDKQFINLLGSQASIRQMRKGNLLLGVANIAALEYGFADSRKGFGAILQSRLTRPLDLVYFQKVRNGEISYYRLFLHELRLYKKLAEEKAVVLLSRKGKVEGDIDTQSGIFLALGLEGGHNLCRDLIGKKGTYDQKEEGKNPDALWEDFCTGPENSTGQGIAANSLMRLHKALWKEGLDIMYLTLTHLTHVSQQLLANFAFGMKILKHAAFYPQGYGLEEAGKEVIRTAYGLTVEINEGKDVMPMPVLIDIKHMSLKSRSDFYEMRRDNEEFQKWPILATHMGVTGYSIAAWKQALKHNATTTKLGVKVREVVTQPMKAGRWSSAFVKDNYHYNPWSINLMDEDIHEVLQSNGLIGMSLDTRIVGFESRLNDLLTGDHAEYLSLQEANWLFGRDSGGLPLADENRQAEENSIVPGRNERQPLHLCFNIMHILAIGKQMGYAKSWQHITIGSDYDGLVNPIHLCEDSSLRPALELALMRWLPIAEQAYHEEHGCGALLPGKAGAHRSIGQEPEPEQLKIVVRDLLYDNGRHFIYRWFLNYYGPWEQGLLLKNKSIVFNDANDDVLAQQKSWVRCLNDAGIPI